MTCSAVLNWISGEDGFRDCCKHFRLSWIILFGKKYEWNNSSFGFKVILIGWCYCLIGHETQKCVRQSFQDVALEVHLEDILVSDPH